MPYTRYFLTRQRQPRLWKCAVLFVDFLGVRQMALGRGRARHLKALDGALRSYIRDFLREDSPWPAAFFSDTLVIAAPIPRDGESQDGESAVGGLIGQAAWLQWDLITRGFFIRGAITVGELHLYRGLIYGPALVKTYELESSRATYPRIVLGEPALRVMRDTLKYYRDPAQAPHNWELLRDQDGLTFVDYLGASIVNYVIDPAEDGLRQHRDLIAERLSAFRGDRHVWEKYRWSADYHDAVCDRFFNRATRLKIPSDALARRIDTLA